MNKLLFYIVFFFTLVHAQQAADITEYLKDIEEGKKERVKDELVLLQDYHKNDPNLLFLEAVLKDDAAEAAALYNKLLTLYPNSRYADAAAYRIYTYFKLLGDRQNEKKYHDLLVTKYSASPYIKNLNSGLAAKPETKKEQAGTQTKEESVQESAPIKTETSYTIQAGAFLSLENAKNIQKLIEQEGLASKLSNKITGGSSFYVVYAGSFKDKTAAEAKLKEINKKLNLQGRVVEGKSL